MRRAVPLVLLAALVPAAPAAGQSARALQRAVDAVGGAAAVSGLEAFSYRAAGEAFVLNEGFNPGALPGRAATFTVSVRHRVGDDAAQAVRLDYVRNSRGTPRNVKEVISGRRGAITGQYGNFGPPVTDQAMTSDRLAAILREQRLLNPHLLLRGRPKVLSTGTAVLGGRTQRLVTLADDVAPIRLYVDRRSGRLTRLTTRELDYQRRDVSIAVRYTGWRAAGDGVLLPSRVTLTVDGMVMHRETRTRLRANPRIAGSAFAVGGDPAPFDAALADRGARTSRWLQAFAHLGFPKDGAYSLIQPKQLAPGIFLLDGVSNSTVVMERASGIVVLEGAVHDLRAEAVIGFIQRTFPGRPVTHVIAHHHHADHNAGMRPFVALGAHAVVHEAAAAFAREVFADRGSKVLPDRLDRSTVPASVDVVPAGGELLLPDDTRPLRIFSEPTQHAADTVMTYVPDAELLFVNGDSYGPGSPPGDGGRSLDQQITARELKVSQIAGAHGRPVSYEEFRAALGG